jgi:hypothetical protein
MAGGSVADGWTLCVSTGFVSPASACEVTSEILAVFTRSVLTMALLFQD